MSKALREGSETCRMYATRFLGVLIRSKSPNITQWGIDLLTAQLCDTTSKTVPFIALSKLLLLLFSSEVDRGGARGAMAPPIIVPRPAPEIQNK